MEDCMINPPDLDEFDPLEDDGDECHHCGAHGGGDCAPWCERTIAAAREYAWECQEEN